MRTGTVPADSLVDATALVVRDRVEDGSGTYDTRLDARWQGGFGFFGGYVAAILTRALADIASTEHQLLTITVTFLERATPGAAVVRTGIERRGANLIAATAVLEQDGRRIARASAVTCPTHRDGPRFVDRQAPRVPPAEACPVWRPTELETLPILDRYELRTALNGELGAGAEVVETAGWAKLAVPAPLDTALVVFLSDTFMPPIMAKEAGRIVVPTVELQVSFRVPLPSPASADAWYLCHLRSEFAGASYLEQSGDVWTEGGQLLARMRHLNHVRQLPS